MVVRATVPVPAATPSTVTTAISIY